MTLAQGDRRGFVVIDDRGGLHVLSKRILDVPAAKIRARLSDLDRDHLPTVEQAREFIREASRQPQPEKPAPAWDRDRDDKAWHDAVIKAAIEKEKIEGRFLEPKRDGGTRAGGRKEAPSPFQKAARTATSRTPPAAAKHTRQQERHAPARAAKEIRVPAIITRTPLRALGKTLDIVGNAFESLLAPKLTPEQIRQGETARQKREAEAEHSIDFSKYTTLRVQERQQQDNEREAERRQHRECGGGGRER